MPRWHTLQAGMLGDLQILPTALAASGEDLPHLETSRAKLHESRATLPLRIRGDAPVKRLNVTLVVEEDLLREARAVAAQRRTSVNEMFRQFLKDVVGEESRRHAALERIQPLLDHPSVHLGGPRPSRDELHER
ncbi:MAG: hypothetical protein ACJ76N_29615 [Thermoanaerobaculia bacterium]